MEQFTKKATILIKAVENSLMMGVSFKIRYGIRLIFGMDR